MLVETQKELLENASRAMKNRTFYAAWPEHPKAYDEAANAKSVEWFQKQLNHNFSELQQSDADGMAGTEFSPFTMERLNIMYPTFSVETLMKRANEVLESWRYAAPDARIAVLLNSLDRIKDRFFDIAYATMHTSGQSFLMAFQASGPHANDRALEAITIGYEELTRFPTTADWEKNMGRFNLNVRKNWKPISRGVAMVIGCSTFPVWNSMPGLYASLVTGNPIIVKPHPAAILPIAIVVAEIQNSLVEAGFSADIVQLAVDTADAPIAKHLAEHPDMQVIDYTGSSKFGDYLEGLHGKYVFTEKAGVNSVILDSVADLDAVMQNLAFSASLYSGQMCTAPQNIFIPENGIRMGEQIIPYETVVEKFAEAIRNIANNPKMGPGTLGAIQNINTWNRISESKNIGAKVVQDAIVLKNEEFPNARIASPLILETDAENFDLYSHELFGPIVVIIKTNDTHHSVEIAAKLAMKIGAISCGAYTTDSVANEYISKKMEQSFVPVSFNMTGPIWINQNAAFSDFHVTGGNPAGNATFTDVSYIVRRFAWVGHREVVA